jgi:hypothetical protein
LDHESSGYKFFKWAELPKDIMRHSRIVLEDFIGNNDHKEYWGRADPAGAENSTAGFKFRFDI